MGHNPILQSMRGIAALVVLYGHAFAVIKQEANSLFAFQATFFQANAAVVFFFVLSGYVLGESVRRFRLSGGSWFLRYAVNRVVRLFPVFAIAVCIGAAAYSVTGVHYVLTDMGPWFYMVSGGPWQWSDLFYAIGTLSPAFNGALWSIRAEFWIILVLPPMVIVAALAPPRFNLAVLCALTVLAMLTIHFSLQGHYLAFVPYCYVFYLGVMLPEIIMTLGRFRSILCSGPVALVALASVFKLANMTASGLTLGTMLILDGFLFVPVVAWAIEARPSSLAARVVACRPLAWLGDVSYSFYAYATPILLVVTVIVINALPYEMRLVPSGGAFITLLAPTLSLLVSLPLAWLSYRYVELPSIQLGRILTGKQLTQRLDSQPKTLQAFP